MKEVNKQSFEAFQNYQESRRQLRTPVKSGVSLKTWYNCTHEESESVKRFHGRARNNGNIDFKSTMNYKTDITTEKILGLKETLAPEENEYLD